jgi:SAM-dependent methyltransferase
LGSKEQRSDFDKYFYYHASVQSPEEDCDFLKRVYKEYRGKTPSPFSMREDFCSTFAITCSWAKKGEKYIGHGVDLDPETLGYGRDHYLSKLKPNQQKRIHLYEKDVLEPGLPTADLVCALNFSYFIFKDRNTLKNYFKNVHETLKDDGVFVLDCFGGSKCYEANEEETEHDDFSYFWDQDKYDPVTNHGMFYIHFKRKGEKKRKKCFEYDWRLWSIPEIRDILTEVGFKQVHVYWEGTDEDGDGDGEFNRADEGEECESWICYITAAK